MYVFGWIVVLGLVVPDVGVAGVEAQQNPPEASAQSMSDDVGGPGGETDVLQVNTVQNGHGLRIQASIEGTH